MKNLYAFLRESNAIEGVYDAGSLEQSLYAWEYLISEDLLTNGVILKTHKILMLNQPLQPEEKGHFRKVPVWIGGRKGKPHSAVPSLMAGWCEDVYTDINGMRRLWKERHIEYEKIHPFVDGNGRTGRLFMNWQRIMTGLPVLVIKESEKHEYYKWFD